MAASLRTYRVVAKQNASDPVREVYRTTDEENASCFAESHFINRHASLVRAEDELGRVLRDRNGREYVWQRMA